jgi:hypothetical protein
MTWISSVGGTSTYFAMQNTGLVREHIAPSFFRSPYDNIAIITLLALAAFGYREVFRSALIRGLVLNYLFFGLFVREVGPYAGMIMPFILAAIASLFDRLKWSQTAKVAVLAIIILPGITLMSARAVDVLINADCRQATGIEGIARRIANEHGRNFKSVASTKYFFLLEGEGMRFYGLDPTDSGRREAIRLADLIIDKPSQNLQYAGFEPAGELACRPKKVPLLPESFYDRTLYSGTLYRKVRPAN